MLGEVLLMSIYKMFFEGRKWLKNDLSAALLLLFVC